MTIHGRSVVLAPAGILVAGALVFGAVTAPAFADEAPAPDPTQTSDPTPSEEPAPDPVPVLRITSTTPVLLTLPATDGFKDAASVHLTSDIAASVVLDAVNTSTKAVRHLVTAPIALTAESTGFGKTVGIPLSKLVAGKYSLRAVQLGHADVVSTGGPVVTVGSGIAKTASLSTSAKTFYPFRDGHYESLTATVSVKDETGTTLPIHGSVYASSGKTKRAATVKANGAAKATISVAGLRPGTGSLTAWVGGPAGTGKAPTPIPLSYKATAVTSVSLSKSHTTVYPSKDGWKDSVVFTATGKPTPNFTQKVSGSITVTLKGKTVKKWAITKSSATKVTWDGRNGGKIVPGTYTVKVSEKGPEGSTVTKSTTVNVSAKKLVTKTTSKWVTGKSGLGTFVTFDSGNAGFCVYDKTGTYGCRGYDAYLNGGGSMSLFTFGSQNVPAAVRDSTVYGTPSVRVSADTALANGVVAWNYAYGSNDGKTGALSEGVHNLGWLALKNNPSKVQVSVGLGIDARMIIERFKMEYSYKVLQ